MKPETYLPCLIGFGAGVLASVYALMLAELVRYATYKRRMAANCKAYRASTEYPSPTLDTRMGNEEWVDTVIAELLRKRYE